jgi:hypothetical protein
MPDGKDDDGFRGGFVGPETVSNDISVAPLNNLPEPVGLPWPDEWMSGEGPRQLNKCVFYAIRGNRVVPGDK